MRRVLVCGGRNFDYARWLYGVLDAAHQHAPIGVIIEGGARGADRLAYEWACSRRVATETYEAEWDKYGKRAGTMRDRRMLDEGRPDVVCAFPGGRGTAHMCAIARAAGVRVVEPKL